MRVMENMQVYRAKMNGGTARITLSADLKRGAYGSYGAPVGQSVSASSQ
jgi:soluble lytic murein transglycosylase